MLTIRGAEFLPSSLCYLLDKSCNCPPLFILLDMQTLARHEDVSIVRKNLATLLLCRHARCFVFRQGAESAAGGSWMWRVRVLFSAVCSVCWCCYLCGHKCGARSIVPGRGRPAASCSSPCGCILISTIHTNHHHHRLLHSTLLLCPVGIACALCQPLPRARASVPAISVLCRI